MLAIGLIPIGYAVWLSFSDLGLYSNGTHFVGFDNYVRSVFTPRFLGTLGTTLGFVVVGLIMQFALGYLLASALHRQLRGYQIARTVLLIPMLLTPVVVGLIWQFMFNPDLGIINAVLGVFGVDLNFFADPLLARGLVVLVDAWMHIPFVMLMLVAGMSSVSDEPLEAAALDGAGWWQTTRYIILPALAPVIMVTLIVRCIDIVRIFDVVFTTTRGGPGTSTETVSMLSYATTFQFYEFSDGAAMSVALAVLMFPVYFLYIRLTKV
ncbi:carbohydrate ABC transporter permease [Microbacterium sp. EST19A]|uniref:carbohydrate ABC transporter permease n=1 Tax=Microbacterium sp. EST19A TaxID=2862681 RepID=UPI001CBD7CC5|nr:sugar ABC transporter permease [Microbacterium sp. EST19A]